VAKWTAGAAVRKGQDRSGDEETSRACRSLFFLGLQGILTSRGLRPGPTLEPCPWFDTNVCAVYAMHVKSE
jgi:hypothetical protein